jgi:hypothetical protein
MIKDQEKLANVKKEYDYLSDIIFKERKIRDWEILGEHYISGPNLKLIFRKL